MNNKDLEKNERVKYMVWLGGFYINENRQPSLQENCDYFMERLENARSNVLNEAIEVARSVICTVSESSSPSINYDQGINYGSTLIVERLKLKK